MKNHSPFNTNPGMMKQTSEFITFIHQNGCVETGSIHSIRFDFLLTNYYVQA